MDPAASISLIVGGVGPDISGKGHGEPKIFLKQHIEYVTDLD